MTVRMDSNQKQQQRQQSCCICVTQPNHLIHRFCLVFYSLVINVIGGDDTGHDVLLCCGNKGDDDTAYL